MNCDKGVLEHFYGDGGGNGTRSDIIKEIKAWAVHNREIRRQYNKPHRVIIGSHKIGKHWTIEHSLKDAGVFYFFINDKTDFDELNTLAYRLFDHFIARRNNITQNGITIELRTFLEQKIKDVLNGKKLQDKFFSLKDLIMQIRSVDPEIKIVFIYESNSKLETELYDASLDKECQFIFKIKVDKNEFFDEKLLTEDSIIWETDDLYIWPLSIEESKKMIRGEHPEVKGGICGITNDVVKKYFSRVKPSSVVDLIIKIVGCHPYLISLLCSRIIDDIKSLYIENTGIRQFLYNSIQKDGDTYDRFFKNFFCNIKTFRNDLFEAYKKWITDRMRPKNYIGEMMKFGMIYKKDNKMCIPSLFVEYILMDSIKNFGRRRTIVVKKDFLSGINHVLETVDKIPGVNLITAPIHSAVKEGLSNLQEKELYEYISSIITNSERKTIEHLSDLKGYLEDLKNILGDIKKSKELRIDNFNESAMNFDPYEIKLNDNIIREIEGQLKRKIKNILLNKFTNNQKAHAYYRRFKDVLKSKDLALLIGGISINDADTNELIFDKIFEQYDTLRNSKEKHDYISALHKAQENEITKDWLTFIEYLKTHE